MGRPAKPRAARRMLAARVEHALRDHLSCSHEHRLRNRQPERFGRLEVDNQLEFRRHCRSRQSHSLKTTGERGSAHLDGLADLDNHQVLAQLERSGVGPSCRWDQVLLGGGREHNVRVHSELRLRPREHFARLRESRDGRRRFWPARVRRLRAGTSLVLPLRGQAHPPPGRARMRLSETRVSPESTMERPAWSTRKPNAG